jgi:hypothetical protein
VINNIVHQETASQVHFLVCANIAPVSVQAIKHCVGQIHGKDEAGEQCLIARYLSPAFKILNY